MYFRTKWVRTAAMLVFLLFGYGMGLDGLVQMLEDGVISCVDWVDSVCFGKPIKIPAKKV